MARMGDELAAPVEVGGSYALRPGFAIEPSER
jgi:hypothetical protein